MREDEFERTVRVAFDTLLRSMEPGARKPESNECYQIVADGADYRLGVVADDQTEFLTIELLVCVLREAAPLDIAVLERALRIAEALRDRSYALAHQGDGWISCDKSISWKNAARECRALLGLLDENGFGRVSALKEWAEEENANKGV